MKYYSHPDKLLIEHLKEVGEKSEEKLAQILKNKEILYLSRIIGYFHDFGKYTSFFQKHLEGKLNGPETRHSLLSSIYFFNYSLGKFSPSSYFPLIGYFCIYSHHGNFKNLKDSILKEDVYFERKVDMLERQSKEGMNKIEIENDFKKIVPDFSFTDINFRKISKKIKKQYIRLHRENINKKTEILSKIYLLFSSLIDSDKKNAGKIQYFERKQIPPYIVSKYKRNKFKRKTRINKIREELYSSSLDVLNKNKNKSIYSLTAPTGSGKTLAVLNIAFNLKKEMPSSRIIYTLPFTSIIDQNFKVINDVFKSLQDFEENESLYLLKYHHLAELKYKSSNYTENISLEKSLLLVDSWESEVIVTTFVQFFETILGNRNRQLLKYHNIAGSIIILDEPQAIPIKYWLLTQKIIDFLVKFMKCKIILMTATQPMIINELNSVELSKNVSFKELNRIKIEVNTNKKTVEKFAEIFVKNYNPQKSYLIILNTIKSSIELFNLLNKKFSKIYYLSANIIPKKRLEVINKIKEKIKNGEKPILISTQVIEAGVDIDFDIVYRDIAPIDSIIQSCGRCNRNDRKKGKVIVMKLCEENKPLYAQYVYGKVDIDISNEILEKFTNFEEKDFPQIFNEYLKLIKDRKSQNSSKEIWDNFIDLNFQELSSFKLIDNLPYYVDVFVEIDQEAKDIWNFYTTQVIPEEDFIKRKIKYLKIRRKLREHMVSVPEKTVKDFMEDSKGNLIHLSNEKVETYYDNITGIKRFGDDDVWIL